MNKHKPKPPNIKKLIHNLRQQTKTELDAKNPDIQQLENELTKNQKLLHYHTQRKHQHQTLIIRTPALAMSAITVKIMYPDILGAVLMTVRVPFAIRLSNLFIVLVCPLNMVWVSYLFSSLLVSISVVSFMWGPVGFG